MTEDGSWWNRGNISRNERVKWRLRRVPGKLLPRLMTELVVDSIHQRMRDLPPVPGIPGRPPWAREEEGKR